MSRKDFQRGFICACATILNEHGAHVQVRDAMRNLGRVKVGDVDEFDLKIFRGYDLAYLFDGESARGLAQSKTLPRGNRMPHE